MMYYGHMRNISNVCTKYAATFGLYIILNYHWFCQSITRNNYIENFRIYLQILKLYAKFFFTGKKNCSAITSIDGNNSTITYYERVFDGHGAEI